jgi:hypothetical protein
MGRRLGAPALAGLLALQAWSCGGNDPLDVCPTGDCTLPGRTVVTWIFNHHPEWLFPNDTCSDLDIVKMHVEVVSLDDPAEVTVHEAACNQGQVTFFGLPPGHYHVALTPLDASFSSLVKEPIVVEVPAGSPGADTSTTVNIPWDAWTRSYTGTFLFRLAWGGLSCDETSPRVAMQRLRLVAGGAEVTARTDTGQRLDGQDRQPCRALSESFAQFAPQNPQQEKGLPFGPATFHVIGEDDEGNVAYDHTFETFVGAARNNPTILFDVPAPEPPDGGVPDDAPIDAPGSIDAPDAM